MRFSILRLNRIGKNMSMDRQPEPCPSLSFDPSVVLL
jgi:hypothetical protein